MSVTNVNAAATTANNGAQSQPLNELSGDSFMVLLTAQLKSQDPFQPTDPTAFVGQLVQFNSLEQMIQMRQLLQQIAGNQTSTGQSSGSATQPPANQ